MANHKTKLRWKHLSGSGKRLIQDILSGSNRRKKRALRDWQRWATQKERVVHEV